MFRLEIRTVMFYYTQLSLMRTEVQCRKFQCIELLRTPFRSKPFVYQPAYLPRLDVAGRLAREAI